jgi:hypothetical protein
MATSARTSHDVTFPERDDAGQVIPGTLVSKPLRESDADDVTCNTCGQVAGLHLYRPSIGYRCATCAGRWGTYRTLTTMLTLADGTDRPVVDWSPGQTVHAGPVARIGG